MEASCSSARNARAAAPISRSSRTCARAAKSVSMDKRARPARLEALLASGARFSDQVMLLSQAHDAALTARRIGPPLVFGRLWEETGIKAVLDALLHDRGFGFPVERAIFTTTLHRILISGSDRACEFWRDDYLIPGAQDLQLHHFYRAMAWP